MPWLYDKSRGNFCRDCCGTYRVLFKGTMGLALFARWLKANRHAFMCKHVAYLSLKHEGLNHVTKGAVEQREKMLRFVYSVAGMPYPLPCVVPFDSAKFNHDEKFLVPCFDNSEEAPPSVVALVARPMPVGPPADRIDALCDQGAGCRRVASASVGHSIICIFDLVEFTRHRRGS